MALPNKQSFLAALERQDCPICYELIQGPIKTSCGHIFCHECAQKWFETSHQCPACRTFMYEAESSGDEEEDEEEDEETGTEPYLITREQLFHALNYYFDGERQIEGLQDDGNDNEEYTDQQDLLDSEDYKENEDYEEELEVHEQERIVADEELQEEEEEANQKRQQLASYYMRNGMPASLEFLTQGPEWELRLIEQDLLPDERKSLISLHFNEAFFRLFEYFPGSLLCARNQYQALGQQRFEQMFMRIEFQEACR